MKSKKARVEVEVGVGLNTQPIFISNNEAEENKEHDRHNKCM